MKHKKNKGAKKCSLLGVTNRDYNILNTAANQSFFQLDSHFRHVQLNKRRESGLLAYFPIAWEKATQHSIIGSQQCVLCFYQGIFLRFLRLCA
jgi:hypothetical protein